MTPAPPAIDARLPVTTGARTLDVPITWFPASGPAAALVWLQHGFARSRRRMAPLASFLAAQGFTVLTTGLRTVDPFARTVQNLGDNTGFLDSLADVLATDLPHAWAAAGLPGTPPARLLAAGHSAGADAAAYVVGRLAGRHVDLGGALLLDPVKSVSGSNLADGLRAARRHNLPVRIVAAPPSRCNNHGSGVATALSQLTGFAGVRLTTGSHLDAEGPTADRLAALFCGAPHAGNVAAVAQLSALWLQGMSETAPDELDRSALVAGLVAQGRAEELWGHNGSTSRTR